MGQWYPYPTELAKTIVANTNIYESLTMFPIFYDCKDTDSGSWGMYIGVARPIIT